MKDFTELEVWKHSRKLAGTVYSLSRSFPNSELHGLTLQIRRSSVSVPSNIAEGVGRNSKKDTLQFLFVARGSLFELETQLYLSFDQEFISSEQLNSVLEEIKSCKKLLNGFINYYQT